MATFREIKEYLLGTYDKKPDGEIPTEAEENAWKHFMPFPKEKYNEVYPSILLGDRVYAKKPEKLKALGVTHVVNCACGTKRNQVNTDQQFYEESGIKFHGIEALDIKTFKLAPHFEAAAQFIDDALNSGGKVYVHCISGVSRSSTTVIAFLLLRREIQLMDAVKAVREKREILPNDGFLEELIDLNNNINPSSKNE